MGPKPPMIPPNTAFQTPRRNGNSLWFLGIDAKRDAPRAPGNQSQRASTVYAVAHSLSFQPRPQATNSAIRSIRHDFHFEAKSAFTSLTNLVDFFRFRIHTRPAD